VRKGSTSATTYLNMVKAGIVARAAGAGVVAILAKGAALAKAGGGVKGLTLAATAAAAAAAATVSSKKGQDEEVTHQTSPSGH
jgi:hypothetical protein